MNLILETLWRLVWGYNDSWGKCSFEALVYACCNLSGKRYTPTRLKNGKILIQGSNKNETSTELSSNYKCVFWPYDEGVSSLDEVTQWLKNVVQESNESTFSEDKKYISNSMAQVHYFLDITKEQRKRNQGLWRELDSCDTRIGKYDFFLYLSQSNFAMDYSYDYIPKRQEEEKVNYNDEYLKMIGAIRSLVEDKHSFVLRYLSFHSLGMSSGERALLNFYSWLSEIPLMMERTDKRVRPKSDCNTYKIDYDLKQDMLFLLDEPDLYMHPQWQKNLVKDLVEELRAQYSDKSVQIIMTTNSALTLSDIPSENTVLIRYNRDKDERTIENHRRGQDNQTFGADIYKLFANSFFLSGSPMGTYAENFINSEVLAPLKEMRIDIWHRDVHKVRDEKNKKNDSIVKQSYKQRLMDLKWKIDMIANIALRRKCHEIFDEVKEWCCHDSDKI